MIVDPLSGETATPIARESEMAMLARFDGVTAASIAELVNQSNLMALEAMLGIAHRSLDRSPLAVLIAEARELAVAATRTTMRLIESQERKEVEREALELGSLALERFRRPDRPKP